MFIGEFSQLSGICISDIRKLDSILEPSGYDLKSGFRKYRINDINIARGEYGLPPLPGYDELLNDPKEMQIVVYLSEFCGSEKATLSMQRDAVHTVLHKFWPHSPIQFIKERGVLSNNYGIELYNLCRTISNNTRKTLLFFYSKRVIDHYDIEWFCEFCEKHKYSVDFEKDSQPLNNPKVAPLNISELEGNGDLYIKEQAPPKRQSQDIQEEGDSLSFNDTITLTVPKGFLKNNTISIQISPKGYNQEVNTPQESTSQSQTIQ